MSRAEWDKKQISALVEYLVSAAKQLASEAKSECIHEWVHGLIDKSADGKAFFDEIDAVSEKLDDIDNQQDK